MSLFEEDLSPRRFQLKFEIAQYTQRDKFIQDYCSEFFNLLKEYTAVKHGKVK